MKGFVQPSVEGPPPRWSADQDARLLATQARLETLKAGLLTAGVKVTDDAQTVLTDAGGPRLTAHEYSTTGGLTLDLGHDVLVNAPVDEWFCADSPFSLEVDAGSLVLRHTGDETHAVGYRPHLPGYLDRRDSLDNAVTDVCFSHADRVRLSPINGCAYSCDYCDLPSERYQRHDQQQLIDALEIALCDDHLPPRHVLISGGSPGSRDLDWFVRTIAAVVDASPLPVDVMMAAVPDNTRVVDRLVDAGVVGFSINLELFGNEASELHIRGKHRFARPHFEPFVSRAVERLGRQGAVRSLIVAGLEAPEVTIDGVALVAELGADPVLSPFRPAQRTSLVERRPPSGMAMLELLTDAREVAARADVRLGPSCIPCQHNTLTFPWDTRPSP
jgi:hypothetical protein